MQTLKMQVYFMDHAIDKHQIIERHRDRLLAKTQPLTKDIINSNSHSKHDDNIFFRKIAMDIIVQHSLGSPSKPEVEHHLIKNNGIKKISLAWLGMVTGVFYFLFFFDCGNRSFWRR